MSRGVPITADRAARAGFMLSNFERAYMTIRGTASGIRMRVTTAKLRKGVHDPTLTPAERHRCWLWLHNRRHDGTRLNRERTANWRREQRLNAFRIGTIA